MEQITEFVCRPSDNADNSKHSLLPLPAIGHCPRHNLRRSYSDIFRGHAPICLVVPQRGCLWVLHSQGVASTHNFAWRNGEPYFSPTRLCGDACHLCTRPSLHSSCLNQCTFLCEPRVTLCECHPRVSLASQSHSASRCGVPLLMLGCLVWMQPASRPQWGHSFFLFCCQQPPVCQVLLLARAVRFSGMLTCFGGSQTEMGKAALAAACIHCMARPGQTVIMGSAEGGPCIAAASAPESVHAWEATWEAQMRSCTCIKSAQA